MFPEWTWVVGLMIGAAIGSFLNVVIYRMPRGLSLGEPKHSFCPNCRTQLRTADLVPLFSWLLQKGRCRHCQNPIAARYFIVELITGGLFAVFWWQHLIAGQDPVKCVVYSLTAAALVAAIFTDLQFFIIPDQINASMLIFGLAGGTYALLTGQEGAWMGPLPAAVAGALVGTGVLWGIAFLGRLAFGKDAMGHGDIKMARGIGAVLLPVGALVSFGLAVFLGAVLGVLQILVRKKAAAQAAAEEEPAEEDYEPESIGSLLKCGLGYVLCFDVIGLFLPKFYEWWFGENPFAYESVEEEDWEPGVTTIPFGPYLALGALALMIFQGPIFEWLQAYWSQATGGL